ncbi:MAG: PepSY-associated TM helix domain-containing protein [Sphingobium sp.]
MKAVGLRQSMASIHGWLGLIAGWIVFAMFLTGTASYFRPEITRWMQPELRPAQVSPAIAAGTAVAHLQRVSPNDEQWFVYLPDERTPATRIFTRAKPNTDPKAKPIRKPELRLDPRTGEELTARDTRGGEHLYRFHFQLQLPHPWGRWLAGLCAMAMLTAILSGVITHKRIFTDFFTLRWGKGQRTWLDAHNASAVLALPFHAMITYTGLITLVAMYMPWPAVANYTKPATYFEEALGRETEVEAAGRPAPLTPVAPLVTTAMREWQGAKPGRIVIRNPNDANATVMLVRSSTDRLSPRGASIVFSGADGHRLSASPEPGPAAQTASVMLGLHMGWFAGPLLRWTYFLLGLTGAAMVGSGLVLWTIKRTKPGASPFFGLRLAERLNIGVIACLPIGMAASLLANRLIPADLPGRADMEVAAMFWVWFGLTLLACIRPVTRAWVEMLRFAALAFAAIPVANAMTTDRGLIPSVTSGDGLFVAFDLTMFAIALLFALAARHGAVKAAAPIKAPRRARQAPVREVADVA